MHHVVDKADVCSSVCVYIGKFLDDLYFYINTGAVKGASEQKGVLVLTSLPPQSQI